jgi:hypothetical protein
MKMHSGGGNNEMKRNQQIKRPSSGMEKKEKHPML